jgi:hypothetical protein
MSLTEPPDGTAWTDGHTVWARNDAEAHAYNLGEKHWFATGSNYPQTWAELSAERDPSTWTQLGLGGTTEQRYTREQAIILGRRDICHSDDNGHDIEQHRIRHADGQLVINTLKCTRCDVVLTPSYPELAG